MSEQRLIDAFEVQRLLNMSYNNLGLDGFSLGFRKALGLAIQTIENAPAIDPVRHGEWVDGMKCSECGQVDTTKPNYCPNCGAKMDKE